MSKIILIDGYSIIHRTFYGVPDLTNLEGLHTNAIYGFLNILFKIIEEEKPDYLAVAVDMHGPTFRHEYYKEYKGTRKPMPSELREQLPLMREIMDAMKIPVIGKAGLEADDILGTLGKRFEKQGLDVTIVSGDRDLLQLASDRLLVRIPKTKAGRTEVEDYHTQDVIDKYSVSPERIIDLKALMGDASDNIPGVPSIGEKTATKLLVEYGSVDNIYAHIDEVKPPRAKKALEEHKDLCDLSYFLATIETKGDVDFDLEDAEISDFYTPELYELFKKLNFKKFLENFNTGEKAPVIEESFKILEDFAEVDKFLSSLQEEESMGIYSLGEKGCLYGVAISLSSGTYYIPVEGFVTESYLASACKKAVTAIREVFACDWKDQMHLLRYGYSEEVPGKFVKDVVIGAYLLNPLKNDYSYDDIAQEHLKLTIRSRKELLGKKSLEELSGETMEQLSLDLGASETKDSGETGSSEAPENVLFLLSCYEAYVAFSAGPLILAKLNAQDMGELYDRIELPLIPVLYEMEYTGIRVHRRALAEYGEKLDADLSRLEKKIYEEAGEEFNIQSPKQLGVILFEKLHMPSGKKTKTGYSTAADVLEKLAPDYPLVADILEYRTIAKLKSTYAEGLAVYIGEDERIHGTFNQTITATGRISSTEPNLQNIPVRMELGRQIRKIFVPREGCSFTDADYSQVELRILAALSGDENLIRAYREARDIHAITASNVFHIPIDEVTESDRRNAKAVNFGIVYGISSFGLGQGLNISRKEAQEYIEAYFRTYPGVKNYLDRAVEHARKKGYITTYFNRRRPVPELSSGNFMQRSFGERVAMNSPIQGTAADIMKLAMIRTSEGLKKAGLKSRIVLQVHDELLLETVVGEEEAVAEILEVSMKDAVSLAVPLEVEVKFGSNWMEAH